MPDMVLDVVIIMCCMFSIVAIIGPNCATICGISASSWCMFTMSVSMESVSSLTPSRVSKMDRIAWHTGML